MVMVKKKKILFENQDCRHGMRRDYTTSTSLSGDVDALACPRMALLPPHPPKYNMRTGC